jgi:protein-S-isoprenylcysteine O-methyltransferase Ste14
MLADNSVWMLGPWMLIGLIWLMTAAKLKPVVKIQRADRRVLQIVLQASVAALMFYELPLPTILNQQIVPHSNTSFAIGVALTTIGAAFAIAARVHLGGNWSGSATIKSGHELVRTGPYAVVRHPIYCGLLIAAAGTGIAFGEVRNLIAFVILCAALRLKQISEERLLVDALGQQYRDYQQAVRGAIVPHVL